jgi:putative sigma-54 modulation protein
MRITLLLLSPLLASAFMVAPNNNSPTRRSMSTESTQDINLVVNGRNIELTPAISEYVEKKIGAPLRKLASGGVVRECDVHLSVNKNPKVKDAHQVDLNANLKGLTIHCTERSPDMYASIDAASSALNRKLLKYKERRLQGFHSGNSMGDDLMTTLEAMEEEVAADDVDDVVDEYVDPEKPTITNVNSFDLKNGIPLEEAIFALDYVDHDFFVFRNEETDKVNVVYKRNAGGVGLIEV